MTAPRDEVAEVAPSQEDNDAPASSDGRPGSTSRGVLTRPAALLLGIAGALLVALVALVGLVVAVNHGESLPGTRLAGRDVGGLSSADTRSAVVDAARVRDAGALLLRAGDLEQRVDRGALGVETDVEGTTRRVMEAGRQGNDAERFFASLASRLGRTREVPLDVSSSRLDGVLDVVAAQVRRTPDPGGFSVSTEQGVVRVTPRRTRTGQELDRAGARRAVEAALPLPGEQSVELPLELTDPGVDEGEVLRITQLARQRLAAPLRLRAPSGEELSLSAARLAPVLGSRADRSGGLVLTVDEQALTAAVSEASEPLRTEPRSAALQSPAPRVLLEAQEDARFRPRPLSATVAAGRAGRVVDVQAAVAVATETLVSGEVSGGLPLKVVPPSVSQQDLKAVDQVIGSFTTRFACCVPRARNIARMAELVDGTVVAAGSTFSLNQAAGPRTEQRGFLADKAIVDGELKDQVGGGVSQFSTTLFNAVWFAGLPVLEHKPHSLYISRYPPGREATLDYSSIDQVWRNDTDSPVVVRATATADSITVALYGHVGNRVVLSDTGPREPLLDGAFRVEVDRTVRQGSVVLSTDSLSWSYAPPLQE